MAEVKDPTTAITDKRFQEPLAIARAGREKETAKAQELAQAEGAVEQEKQRVAEIESGLQTAAAEKEAGAVRGAREAYQEKLEREPLPEFVPTQDNVQSIASLFSLIGVMGMVAGKGDALRAMHAMNGMLEGHQKGRADLYKQEKSTFEKNFNSMLKKHEEFRKEMEDAVKTAATDRELGYQKAREAAVKAGSNVVKAMIEKFGVAKAYESLVANNQSVEKAYEIYRQEKRHAEQMAQQERLRKSQMELQRDIAKMQAGQKLGTAGTRATIYQRTGKLVPTDKEAEAIGSIADAVDEVSRLREKLKDPEVQTGLISSLAPAIQKIASVTQPLDEAQFKNLVDQELTGNDKTTLFIKDAMLAAFKIEQGLVGSRVPVATQRAVGPILDPRAYNKQTFDKLLSEREDLLYKNANRRGFEKKDIEALFIEPVPGVEQKKTMPTGDKLKAYSEAHFNGDENAAREYLKTQGYE